MEKGYRDYGHDIDNTDCVLEAGLGFAVDLDKPGGFVGRDAVMAAKAAGPLARRLVQVLVTDPEPLMFHAEVVHRDGEPVGYVRAASYGHTLGGAVGLAMVEAAPARHPGLPGRGRLGGRHRRPPLPRRRLHQAPLRPGDEAGARLSGACGLPRLQVWSAVSSAAWRAGGPPAPATRAMVTGALPACRHQSAPMASWRR